MWKAFWYMDLLSYTVCVVALLFDWTVNLFHLGVNGLLIL